MKKCNIFYCLASICLSCIWASCDKLPANGKLDGFWQVTEVQFARNGIYDSVVPMKDRDVFWGIQLGLLNIQGIDNGETSQTLCRFSFTGDQLAITTSTSTVEATTALSLTLHSTSSSRQVSPATGPNSKLKSLMRTRCSYDQISPASCSGNFRTFHLTKQRLNESLNNHSDIQQCMHPDRHDRKHHQSGLSKHRIHYYRRMQH